MIVPARVMPPIALLVALMTLTVTYNAGIASAPREFFAARDDIVLLIPSLGVVTSTGTVPEQLARVLRTREDVSATSPEIVVMTTLAGESIFARGVDAEEFLRIERAHVAEGALPSASHEALAGVDLARRLELRPGASLLVPGSLREHAARVTITGLVEGGGLVRDELLVSVPVARALAGLAPGGVHFIRVETSDPENVTRLASAVHPVFTYSDVRLSAEEVVLGEPVALIGNLTNWGLVGATKDVNATVEGHVVGRAPIFVPPRTTVPFRLPLHIEVQGVAPISLNPTFNLTVRPPPAELLFPGGALVSGRESTVTLLAAGNRPVADALVRLGSVSAVTDAAGQARLVPGATGKQRLVASEAAGGIASREVLVVPPELADVAVTQVLGIEPADGLVSSTQSARVFVTIANMGGAAGNVAANVTVDGAVAAVADADLLPGQERVVEVVVGPLARGRHLVDVEGLSRPRAIESVDGDPHVETALRAREAARADPQLSPRVGASATDYVDRIVRNVAIAATALTIAAGALVALALVAVWSRHLAERAPEIGTLKALGASRDQVGSIVARRAALWALVATAIGALLGLAAAFAVDSTGFVRAFGHRVPPRLSPWAGSLLVLVSIFVNVILARTLASRLYDRAADELIARQVLLPSRTATPTLHEALAGEAE